MYRDKEVDTNPVHQPAAGAAEPRGAPARKGNDRFSLTATLASYEVEEIEAGRLGKWLMRHGSEYYPSTAVPKHRAPPRRRWNDALSLRSTIHSYEVEEIAGGRLGAWILQNPTKETERTLLFGNVHRLR
jgi:hypothetical protein